MSPFFGQPAVLIQLGPLKIDFDQPLWLLMIPVGISVIGLIGFLWLMHRIGKRDNITLQKYHPWVRASALIAVVLVVFSLSWVVINRLESIFAHKLESTGPPVVFVSPQDTYITSDIVFCVPNVVNGGEIDIPKKFLLGFLFNSSKIKLDALGRFPVGIDSLSWYIEQSIKGDREYGPTVPGKKPVYVISVQVPRPNIIRRYASLYIEGQQYHLSDSVMADDFGAAWERCGKKATHFHGSSGGGILYRMASLIAGPDDGKANSAQSLALDRAYKLATTPSDDKSFGGRSALQQAQDNTRPQIEKLIKAANKQQIEDLRAKGFDVRIEVSYVDGLKLKSVPTSTTTDKVVIGNGW